MRRRPIAVLTQLPETFQRLTAEDQAIYGEPVMVQLPLPPPKNPACQTKLQNWLDWRGAPYPAERHSEYLHRPDIDDEGGPKILISAIMPPPASFEAYLAAISPDRRYDVRGRKAANRGYTARAIKPQQESRGIWEIIHSSDQRQGRPIAPMFGDRPPDYEFPSYINYEDPTYTDICCGVFAPDGGLAAYLLGKRIGDHVQYDEIMGHADHIAGDVMYLLHFAFLQLCMAAESPPQCLNYGSWYSGVNAFSAEGGLNRWKRKVNFKPAYLIAACS